MENASVGQLWNGGLKGCLEASGIPGFLVSSELEDGSKGFYCGDFWCKSMASEPVVSEMQAEKQVGEMMQNLKIQDSAQVPAVETNANIAKEAPGPEGSPSDATSSVTSLGDCTSTKGSELEQETVVENGLYYPSNNYYGYYYPGYDVGGNEWDEHGAYLGMEGLEIPYTGVQAENGPLLYYMPGYGYPQPAYNPYNAYFPGAMVGADGLLAHQPYYPSPIYQQPLTSPAYFQPPVAYGSEVAPFSWESGLAVADRGNGNPFNGSAAGGPRTSHSTAAVVSQMPYSKAIPPARKQNVVLDSKGSAQPSEGLQSSHSAPAGQPNIHSIGTQSQSGRPVNKIPSHGSTGQTAALPKGYVPLGKVAGSSNQGKANVLYPNNAADFKPNGHEYLVGDRLKTRAKVNGNGNLDVLNEQNRGPRINKMRNPWLSPVDANTGAHGMVENTENCGPEVNRDQFNLADFPTKYDNALFFVIKSYSEDDVHKSIKYNVWASTPNGNKRLDAAYQVARERSVGNPGGYPVFLFFSVNASGQFCGVAEMVSSVDFNTSMSFWQQDKWNGFFPVKWHIIKDVPNSQFRHIILENNEHKPVTNSRDTQEIKFTQGIEMLSIFKNYSAKTSILDDFMFYEHRQKTMQDKKRQPNQPEQLQPAMLADAVQKMGLGEQLDKTAEDARNHSDRRPANGNQLSDSSNTKNTALEPSSVRKEQIAPSKQVDLKKNESRRLGDESSKKE